MISDPNILVSMINMKLRDGDYSSLDDACLSLGIDKEDWSDVLQQQVSIMTQLSGNSSDRRP